MTTRVALVLLLDVDGDIPDPASWGEGALRYQIGGDRLRLPASVPLHPRFVMTGVSVTAVDILGINGALQAGALRIETRQPVPKESS